MRLSTGGRLVAPLRRLWRGRRPLILTYHRVAEPRSDHWALAVSPKHFGEHLAVLADARRVVRLGQIADRLDSGDLGDDAVAITFDDGYADNLHAAKPLLERHSMPATVFVTTGTRGSPFWWDEHEQLIGHANGAMKDKFLTTWRQLKTASADEREIAVASLRQQSGLPPGTPPDGRPLSEDELTALASGGLVEIGAHGVSHASLPGLPHGLLRREIEEPKAFLEARLKVVVHGFAYPYGEWNAEAVIVAKASGYRFACTTAAHAVSRRTDPFLLPRFPVGNWTREEFAGRLARSFA
ncbi:MAG: polysaccharide deacetylase [Rhodospirillales bacterium]|nr:polysaccharide deacetylase [Rhodospirillales bacterium]